MRMASVVHASSIQETGWAEILHDLLLTVRVGPVTRVASSAMWIPRFRPQGFLIEPLDPDGDASPCPLPAFGAVEACPQGAR